MDKSLAALVEDEVSVKIVWLSDLHVRASYEKSARDKIDLLFDSFIMVLQQEQPIDYIILNGDIAFSGSISDYTFFRTCFIQKLYDGLKQPFPKIITLPGNHDINRKNIRPFEEYITTYNDKEKSFASRNKQLVEKKWQRSFFDSFASYSASFGQNAGNEVLELWRDFFNFDDDFEVSSEYNKNRLFGYLIDHRRQLIFVMLNTAWYSIGDKFNELLVRQYVSEKKKVTSSIKGRTFRRSELIDLLNRKDNINEYGNQIIGRDIFPTEELLNQIEQNNSYRVISCMHHPLNWLNWKELYDYELPSESKYSINRILKRTDVLLTGHEHVPISHKPEKIYNQVWHVKSGMFMEDQIDLLEGEKYFKHSRFSILEINTQKPVIVERRFLFKDQKWVEKPDFGQTLALQHRDRHLSTSLKEKIIATISSFKIEEYLLKKGLLTIDNYIVEELSNDKTDYKIYKFITGVKGTEKHEYIRLCILPCTNKFSGAILNNFSNEHFLYKLVQTHFEKDDVPFKVHFFWVDLIVSEDLSKEYLNSPSNFSKTFYAITKYSDFHFDQFRHHFFEAFENGSNNKMDFNMFIDIQFINETIPYYIFSEFLK